MKCIQKKTVPLSGLSGNKVRVISNKVKFEKLLFEENIRIQTYLLSMVHAHNRHHLYNVGHNHHLCSHLYMSPGHNPGPGHNLGHNPDHPYMNPCNHYDPCRNHLCMNPCPGMNPGHSHDCNLCHSRGHSLYVYRKRYLCIGHLSRYSHDRRT